MTVARTNRREVELDTRSVQVVLAAQVALTALPMVPAVVQAASPTIAMVLAAAIAPTAPRRAQHRTTAAKLTGIQHLFHLLAALEVPAAIHGTAHFHLLHVVAVVVAAAVLLLSVHSVRSNTSRLQPMAQTGAEAARRHPVAAGVEAVVESASLHRWE